MGDIQSALDELREHLEHLYGTRLKGVYLFGSHACGTHHADSDVDVLVVLDHLGRYYDEIVRTSEIIATLSLAHGITLSRVFVSETDWREGVSMFLVNARQDAVAV